jgi:hypothetical protein
MAQGFLFARPLAADVVEGFLRDSNGLADMFADEPSLLAGSRAIRPAGVR